MKLNSSPDLVMACLVSGSMLIADCVILWEAVILFSPSLKRKDIDVNLCINHVYMNCDVL